MSFTPRSSSLRIRLLCVTALALSVASWTGCEQPNPLQAAPPIGEYPKWGTDFAAEAKEASGSLLGTAIAEGPVPSGPGADAPQQGGSAVPGNNPMAGEKWGDGDIALGKTVFLNKCALCHGPDGTGGNRNNLVVPTLRDAGWHDAVDDGHIARTVSHGKGKMPSFMGQLKKEQLNGLISFVRTLKRSAAAPAPDKAKSPGAAPTPGAAPAPDRAKPQAPQKPQAPAVGGY